MPGSPAPPLYQIETLAPGVFAAIATGFESFCNAAVVDLGGLVILFDTGQTPRAGRFLKRAALTLTGRTPDLVVNSHGHFDHINGNAALADSAILLSSATAHREILARALELARAQSAPETITTSLREVRADLERRPNHPAAADWCLRAEYLAMLARNLPQLRVCPPHVTFGKRLLLRGRHLTAVLESHSNAHSASDTVLSLPDVGVALMGDLGFSGEHRPPVSQERAGRWREILSLLRRSGCEIFLPGHGPVTDRSGLDQMRAHLAHSSQRAGSTHVNER